MLGKLLHSHQNKIELRSSKQLHTLIGVMNVLKIFFKALTSKLFTYFIDNFHFENGIHIHLLFAKWKWTYILDLEPYDFVNKTAFKNAKATFFVGGFPRAAGRFRLRARPFFYGILAGDALASYIHRLGSVSAGHTVGCLKTVFTDSQYVIFGIFLSWIWSCRTISPKLR